MGFRPRPWPTAIALIGVAILLGLGTWQLQRLAWKEALLATIASRMEAPSAMLPMDFGDPDAWTFRRAKAEGHFVNDKAIWLYGRTYDGKAGIHLLVPLDRGQGVALLVDRGFVPLETGNQLAAFAAADGDVTVQGIVRAPEPPGLFSPGNRSAQNIWYDVDIPAIEKTVGMKLAPVYLATQTRPDSGWPAATGGTESSGIRNEHLNYAIFWYTMAAALAVIYVLSSRSRRL
jgi:surfeit locus 1 family protein